MVPTQTMRNLPQEWINAGTEGEEQELGYFGVKCGGLEAGKSRELLPWQCSGHAAPGASSAADSEGRVGLTYIEHQRFLCTLSQPMGKPSIP